MTLVLTLHEPELSLTEVTALAGSREAVRDALATAQTLPIRPNVWLVVGDVPPLEKAVAIDKSSAFTAFEIEGEGIREVLKSLCRVDLDPREFAIGAVATTIMAQITVTITRVGEHRFLLLAPSTYGRHFRDAIQHAIHALSGANP